MKVWVLRITSGTESDEPMLSVHATEESAEREAQRWADERWEDVFGSQPKPSNKGAMADAFYNRIETEDWDIDEYEVLP